MRALLAAGGSIETDFAGNYLSGQRFDLVVAADAGMEALDRLCIVPDLIVGDFDSADPAVLEAFRERGETVIIGLQPEKDDTDSEHALRTAISRGAEDIVILGATGTRLDHVLGNLNLLGIGLEERVRVTIVDRHNRIRLTDSRLVIKREEQFGRYLSLIPFMGPVRGVCASGVKYPLRYQDMGGYNTLGISNEITGERAEISVEEGTLLVIESQD